MDDAMTCPKCNGTGRYWTGGADIISDPAIEMVCDCQWDELSEYARRELGAIAQEETMEQENAGPPNVKTVSVVYERKFNLGDYNSAHIGITAWSDLDENDDLDAATAELWDWAKGQVKAQALPLLKGAPPQPAAPQPSDSGDEPPAGSYVDDGGDEQQMNIDFLRVTAPKGKPVVEFWRENRKWPEAKWWLGGEALLEIAPTLAEAGWTAERFAEVGREIRVPMVLYWKPSPKNEKWKDIQSVVVLG